MKLVSIFIYLLFCVACIAKPSKKAIMNAPIFDSKFIACGNLAAFKELDSNTFLVMSYEAKSDSFVKEIDASLNFDVSVFVEKRKNCARLPFGGCADFGPEENEDCNVDTFYLKQGKITVSREGDSIKFSSTRTVWKNKNSELFKIKRMNCRLLYVGYPG